MKEFTLAVVCVVFGALMAFAQGYETGGPLAGVPLPLMPVEHGEKPGHPGCIDGRSDEGLPPERLLYPGAVEKYRAYMFKYMPIRSTFDAQSRLENWVAGQNMPGVAPAQAEQYAAPVYWNRRHRLSEPTGKFNAPVPVVRFKVGEPVVTLDLGTRDIGLYAVRIIGAVETKDINRFRKALFLRAEVNDGPNGETSVYRQRLGYCDEFYSVAEIYFHALDKRRYTMTLQIDEGSAVDLLVHNITLDDVLAGHERRAIKTRAIHGLKPGVTLQAPALDEAARLERDAAIWNGYMPLNAQPGVFPAPGYGNIPGVVPGTDTMLEKEIVEKYGAWVPDRKDPTVLMVNKKLNLAYTVDDARAYRPLPDPYPFKDNGLGLSYPAPENPNAGRMHAPVAFGLLMRLQSYERLSEPEAWRENGDVEVAHDGAMKLIRFAWSFPTVEDVSGLMAVVHDPAQHGRGDRCRRRETGGGQTFGHFSFQFHIHEYYDKLFPYISTSERLARSVGRFVPWVETPRDVVKLLDVYLMQMHAKRLLRYQYYGDGREPALISEVAAVMGDASVTDPWMDWLFSKVFYYPRPLAGLPDYLVGATGRDGRSTIGSSSYVMGDQSAASIAEVLETYVANGGNPKYNLLDLDRFPKVRTAVYFPIRAHTAGLWTMRMGNVSGPDKRYAKAWHYLTGHEIASGWAWTRDLAFAWILRHYTKPQDYTADEWAAIDAAAAKVERAPWMTQRSRILPNYAAFLESGVQHDDFRFRRSVQLRIGTGSGHAHSDALDLQITAHGLPMTVDAGQRPGYSSPGDRHTFVHNTVQVDGRDWPGVTSWVRAMSDLDGARYIEAQIAPTGLASLARRQVALIDVDEGRGSVPLPPGQVGPKPHGLPTDVVTPRSYVFDVFRVAGGKTHTYCFHATVNDQPNEKGNFQPVSNALDVRDGADEPYLKPLHGIKRTGTAPENLQVTFQMQKKRTTAPEKPRSVHRAGSEEFLSVLPFDPDAPTKFTRWHVLGEQGAKVMKGDLHCTRWLYYIPNYFVQRQGEGLQSAFAAVVEPYVGEPFIASATRLPIDGNEDDAQQAVAVEVKTTNGHTDLCFADGRPEKMRSVGAANVAGEFAYVSTGTQGLRAATLTGGKLLEAPGITIRAAARERTGTIVAVDYAARTVRIDNVWPAEQGERILELFTQPDDGGRAWRTGFTSVAIAPKDGGSEITFLRSADLYRGSITDVNGGTVTCRLPVPIQTAGFRGGWTAANEDGTKTWKVTGAAGTTFKLVGDVSAADFAPQNALRLWEYGVGDTVRRSTVVSVRRVDGQLVATGDVDAEITIGEKTWRLTAADLLTGTPLE